MQKPDLSYEMKQNAEEISDRRFQRNILKVNGHMIVSRSKELLTLSEQTVEEEREAGWSVLTLGLVKP